MDAAEVSSTARKSSHMLQENKLRIKDDDIQPYDDPPGLVDHVYWAIGILRRQYLVILFVTLLVTGIGLLYLSFATPIYTAETSVYIELHGNPTSAQEAIFGSEPIEIDSQIQIIKSKTIASSVIKKLQLTNDGRLRSGAGFIGKLWNSLINFGTTVQPPSGTEPSSEEIEQFEANLDVKRAIGDGRVIKIGYSSTSPDRSAEIANAIANAYINDQLEAKYQSNRLATNWLQDRLRQLGEEADAAQRAVDAFKKQNSIVSTGGQTLDDQQTADLNSQLIAARAQTSDALVRLDRLQASLSLDPSDKNIDAVISEITNPIVTTLRQQYLELARRESEWSARFGRDHLAVVNLRNRMQEIRQSIFEELRLSADRAKNDYETAKQRQNALETQLANIVKAPQSLTQAKITLRGLESTATGYRNLYNSFLQRYMGSTQQADFPISEAQVISPALPPLHKSAPKTAIILALSIFAGVAFGVGLGVLRDAMDHVFRTAKQLEAALQLPCIALVPLLKDRQSGQLSSNATRTSPANSQKAAIDDSDIFWTVVKSPLSGFAEAIRSIKLAADLQVTGQPCKVIGFTSIVPNEGKSTLAASFAQLIGQVGGRGLLIDCDLRNPSLSRLLAPSAAVGIVDVVAGRNSVDEAILKQPEVNLAFLPAGKRIPRFLTSEIIGGEPMSKLFEALRHSFDYIIVDLPPLEPIIDVRASANLVDFYLLTVEWGRTKIDLAEQTLKGAPNIYDRLIGTVLNKTDMDFITRYDSSGRYKYNKDYARYGYHG